ncbi:hypothetical protein AUP68_14040 [Ilyonectria robusta]
MSLKLSRLNATRVILAVRLRKKGEAARASIEAASNRKNVVEVWQVDVSDYHSIQDFVAKFNSLDRLDVVVANAGVLKNTYEELGGTEITVKVNVIGTFLLVVNILPMLRRSREKTGQTARLIITSSVMHEDVRSPLRDLVICKAHDKQAKFAERHDISIFDAFNKGNKGNKSYISDRYNNSKLLEVFLTRSIAAAMHKGPHAT